MEYLREKKRLKFSFSSNKMWIYLNILKKEIKLKYHTFG